MYPFVFLAPVLALVAGQVEPSEAAGASEPPGIQEPVPQPPDGDPAGKATPRPEPPAPPRGSLERAAGARQRSRPDASPAPARERPAAPVPRPASTTEPERAQVARAALAFLDALLAGDASGLAAASTDRFCFDGDVRTGKDEVRQAWRTILSGRDAGQHPVLLDLEVLPATDAISRLGPPPPRLAPLASARGTWVGIANVSGRPVVVFVTREGNRWAVAGME